MRELLPWLELLMQRPWRLFVGVVLMLLTLLSGMGLLALSGWFITATALTGLLLAAGVQASLDIYVPGSGIRALAITRTAGRYAERVYNHSTVLQLLTDIRLTMFAALCQLSPRQRAGFRDPEWLSRLVSDIDALDTLYLRLIAPTALAIVITTLLLALSALFYSPALAFFLVPVLVATLLVVTVAVYCRTGNIARDRSEGQVQVRTATIDYLEGLAELTAAGRAGKQTALLLREAKRLSRLQMVTATRIGWHQATGQVLLGAAVVGAVWMGLELYQRALISGPVVVLMPVALLGLQEVYLALPEAFARLGGTISAAQRLNRSASPVVIEETPSQQPATQPSSAGVVLELDDISFHYKDHPRILSHFSLSVNSGERLAVIGGSGSGKSTLADLLAGLLEPTAGQLFRPEKISYLTQQTVLFEDTLKANLLLGRPEASHSELWQVLELVQLADRFIDEPEQLETWLGASGHRLSGGEARRVALARVLLSNPSLIVLDEPFTGVDTATRQRVCQQLEPWLQGRTLVTLGHSREVLPVVDRTIRL